MNVMMLVTRKIKPNPANRRIDDRSVVAARAAGTDCQLFVKDACNRCRWAYRSSLMTSRCPRPRGTGSSAGSCEQRLARAEAGAARASGSAAAGQWWAIAPSTRLVRSGMTISAVTAPKARRTSRSCGCVRLQVAAKTPQRPDWRTLAKACVTSEGVSEGIIRDVNWPSRRLSPVFFGRTGLFGGPQLWHAVSRGFATVAGPSAGRGNRAVQQHQPIQAQMSG